MRLVSGSFMKYSMKSISERSALFPRLMNFENPTSLPMAQSMMAIPMAPDWEKKPIVPLGSMSAAKVAFMSFAVLMRPRQFGPRMRMPCSLPICFQLFLEQRAFLARLLEPRADDNGRLDPRCRALPERGGNEVRRDDDDREVDGLPDVRYFRVCLEPEDLAAGRIDGIETTGESEPTEIPEDRVAHFFFITLTRRLPQLRRG